MKTVAGSVCGLDENFRYCGEPAPKDLGRVHGDLALRYLLGLPVDLPEDLAADACRPLLRLEGRKGMWITFTRPGAHEDLRLSMKDGESAVAVDEMQAAYRLRMFVEHWGEETDLTQEVRLPPEVRRQIREREQAIDEARKKRLEAGPRHREFGKRTHVLHSVILAAAGLAAGGMLLLVLGSGDVPCIAAAGVVALSALAAIWIFLKRYLLIVDRDRGEILERDLGGVRTLAKLDGAEFADVDGLEDESARCELIVRTADGVTTVGKSVWTPEQATAIAEAVNDALGIDEARRKFLAYRRQSGRGSHP